MMLNFTGSWSHNDYYTRIYDFFHGNISLTCILIVLIFKDVVVKKIIVRDAHERIFHAGVKETLTEVQSSFWLIQGKQFIRHIIHKCVICHRSEGRPYQGVPPPPLPEYRVKRSRPFQFTGVDFAGPLYVKPSSQERGQKAWLCLYTCPVTRAIHLDLIPNLNTLTILRSFKRLTSHRGVPANMISNNGKTFKSASKTIYDLFTDPVIKKHFSDLQLEWSFNLEKPPWWGGIFERLIKSAKRCLRKTLVRASLTYDELILVVETEAVLNSRPLSYISSDDLEEPLTPSHMLISYRVLSLPDTSKDIDPNYQK